jgi:hypothetical protein
MLRVALQYFEDFGNGLKTVDGRFCKHLAELQQEKTDIGADVKNAITVFYGYAMAEMKRLLNVLASQKIGVRPRSIENALPIPKNTLLDRGHRHRLIRWTNSDVANTSCFEVVDFLFVCEKNKDGGGPALHLSHAGYGWQEIQPQGVG